MQELFSHFCNYFYFAIFSNMRRLIFLILFIPFLAKAQNTVTLPVGTTATTVQTRYLGTDSLKRRFDYVFNGYNEIYTATQINRLLRIPNSIFNKRADSLYALTAKLTGNNTYTGNQYFNGDVGISGLATSSQFTTNNLHIGTGLGGAYIDFISTGGFPYPYNWRIGDNVGGLNDCFYIKYRNAETVKVDTFNRVFIDTLKDNSGRYYLKTGQAQLSIAKSNADSLNNWQVSGASVSYGVSTEHASEGLLDPYSGVVYNIFRIGTDAGHLDNSGRIVMRKSTDNGKTYSSVTTIFNSTWDDRNVSGSITSSGRIIVFIRQYDYIGVAEKDWGYIYSDNGGTTWSSFVSLAPSVVPLGTVGYGKVIQANGKLLQMTYTGQRIGRLLQSTDNGITWTVLSTPYDFSVSLTKKVTEPAITYLGANKLIMVARNDDNGPYYQFKSSDNGSSWTDQGLTNTYNVPVGVRSACPAILYDASKDEVILFGIARSGITSQRYSDAMQVYVNKSADVFASSLAWTQRATLQRPAPNFRTLYGQPAVAFLDDNNIVGMLTDGYQSDPTVDANKEFEALYNFTYNYKTTVDLNQPAQVQGYLNWDGTSVSVKVPREGTMFNPLSNITNLINPGTFELTAMAGAGATTNVFQARSTNGTAYLWHANQAGNWFWDITPTSVLTTNNFLMVDATTKQQYIMAGTGTGTPVKAISPTFTGTPLSTTAAVGTNTTQIATTAFVQAATTGGETRSYTSITATYSILTTDYYIDCTANSFTVTLPTSALGRTFEIMNNGSGTITVQAAGGQLVNGSATYNIAAGSAFKFIGNGTLYRVKY